MLTWMTACAAPLEGPIVLDNARLPGGERVSLEIRDRRFAAVGDVPPSELRRVDVSGAFVVPAFIDSHVHFSFWPVGEEHADGGIAAAVDLAAPIGALGAQLPGYPRTIGSGPMITAIGGYPTQSWGSDGYGLQVSGPEQARDAVEQLARAGAHLIKVPIEEPGLSDASLVAIVQAAHAHHLVVVAHALDDAGALRAATAGIDGLAHTPVEPLSEAVIARWAGPEHFVISTLRAFGSLAAPGNLRALRAAGVTVLYGTDLGNTRQVGIDPVEVSLLLSAGLDGAAVLDAATRAPAARFGLSDLGEIAVGREASFLLLDADPLADPLALSKPREVWIAGHER